ncbi:MAG: PDDEXK nuclease domain-containing protein [Ignavibacteriales bacterium]|nr:PDDEXK nuclease domain-containing protein [Ignavibacteriales bacterium]
MNKHKVSELHKGTAKGNAVILGSDYDQFLSALKSRIQTARLSAARAVNRDLILLYWDIGRAIVEKQKFLNWGDSVVEMVAKDLQKAFPDVRGFSADSIWRMRQFFAEYSDPAFLEQVVPEMKKSGGGILAQAVPELARGSNSTKHDQLLSQSVRELLAAVPWGHHVELLKKVKAPAARVYYLQATAGYGWTRNVLLNQIKAGAYERSLSDRKKHNFSLTLPEHLAEQADEALKSSYNLEFLGISREVKERQLEDRLLERLREFILELGYGFCFVGRQHRLVLGQKEYFIDLLFYHRFIKALVAFELKVGPFEPEYAGKMDFYLNLLNEKERAPDDHPSIGIILCAEKDNLEVEFSLKSKTNPIGVAEYHLQSKLPPELRGKLPTARQLMDVVRPILPAGR